jgi:hypothetical protein
LAKHRKPKNRRTRSAVLVGATAVGISTTLVFAEAPHAGAAPPEGTVIGVGGAGDPTGSRIEQKFNHGVVPENWVYTAALYPALVPVDPSVKQGVPALDDKISNTPGKKLVVGYSEGAIVAELEKRILTDRLENGTPTGESAAPAVGDLTFLFIASPAVPNGGIYARFPRLALPGFTGTGAAEPSPYGETFVTIQYDAIGDFPAYFNPLSLANAAVGAMYLHGDKAPDGVDLTDEDQLLKKEVTKPGEGTDTYILVTVDHLPLLQPVRDASAIVHTTALTEPALGAVEPTLRLLVDMGYTDRTYENADQPTQFSMITPPARIIETAAAMPDALEEGADNFVNGLPALSSVPRAGSVASQRKAKLTSARPSTTSDGNKVTPATTASKRTFGDGRVTKRLVDALKNPRGGPADTPAGDPATSAGPSSDED